MNIEVGQVIGGFGVERKETVKELSGTAYVMSHKASGARLIVLQNDDAEMSFSVSFATPAADDTGVFHILEHSMLCGSERYPVKKPFTTMLKTSMQTYLNAFTGPDYTMYPVASTNEQDLVNLMDVYMDAVLQPLFLKDPNVFRQEGWHVECEDGDAATLGFSGVVYNEMKGALSSPVRYALRKVQQSLFPKGTYGFESGGDPASITSLRYEDFVDAYKRHYRLDNCTITLYGAVDVESVLRHLDEVHLQPQVARQEELSSLGAPNPLVLQEPLLALDESCCVRGGEESAMIAFGSVLTGTYDIMRTTAAGVLCDALFGNVEAPLRKMLLESGICGDVAACNLNSGCQSHVLVVVLAADLAKRDEFLQLVKEGCEQVLASGQLEELVDATVATLEFAWREGPEGAAGISFAQDVNACWPYGSDPLAAVRYEDYLAWHKASLEDGTYARLLRELFVDYNHAACVCFEPTEDADVFKEAERIAALAEGMDEDELLAASEQAAELARLRLEPEDPQALLMLPRLDREDLPAKAKRPEYDDELVLGTTVSRMLAPTHGIDYVDYYFDLSELSLEDLQLVSLMCALVGELQAGDLTPGDAQVQIKRYLGAVDCDVIQAQRWEQDEACALLQLGFATLSGKREQAHELFWKLFSQTDFSDEAKVRQIVDLLVLGLEQTVSSKAAVYAVIRARRAFSSSQMINDAIEGVESYRFLKNLQKTEDITPVCLRLGELRDWLVARRPNLVCYAGDDEGLELVRTSSPCMRCEREVPPARPFALELPQAAGEGFAFQTSVAANATVLLPPALRHLDGCDTLAQTVLNWDYLWDVIRVKGGAYGCNCSFDKFGRLVLVSARDPRVDGTFEDFEGACEWLANHEFDEAEVDGLVISSIAKADKPKKVHDKLTQHAALFFNGRPLEDRDRMRAEILAATSKDLRSLGQQLLEYRPSASICSLASREMLERSERITTWDDLLG